MTFVDTNYFMRFLANRESEQGKMVKKLFEAAALKKVELVSSLVVFFEIYWLMKSIYGKKKGSLQIVLREVISMNFVRWEGQKKLTEAVEMMNKTNFDLEEAYNLVYVKSVKAEVMGSFDKKLQKNWAKK